MSGTTIDTTLVADRLAAVRDRIAAAGGAPDDIVVVAVTKGFGIGRARRRGRPRARRRGRELRPGAGREVRGAGRGRDRRWHFLGRVQRNKVKSIAPAVHLWQGVDRLAAGEEIARRAPGARVLVQVRIDDEEGVGRGAQRLRPRRRARRWSSASTASASTCGASWRWALRAARSGPGPGFRKVAALADSLGLAERSMGMTDDLDVAVEEGSTMVRVGRGLFGARPVAPKMRR